MAYMNFPVDRETRVIEPLTIDDLILAKQKFEREPLTIRFINLAGQKYEFPKSSSVAVEVKTLDDFQKLDLAAQLDFKNNNPQEYQKLFK